MPINTRNERAAAISIGKPFAVVFPNADGALDSEAERQQAAYSYPGIAAGEATESGARGPGGDGWLLGLGRFMR